VREVRGPICFFIIPFGFFVSLRRSPHCLRTEA
jgi:hypothetical protein